MVEHLTWFDKLLFSRWNVKSVQKLPYPCYPVQSIWWRYRSWDKTGQKIKVERTDILCFGDDPYAWLRQSCKFHHQASFLRKNSSHFHWMSVSILFNSTLIGIQLCKILQPQNFKTRLGGEICSSDVNMHKDNCRVR